MATGTRNIGAVLDAMIAVIPAGNPLAADLTKCGDSLHYLAPEQVRQAWTKVYSVVVPALPVNPAELADWQIDLLRVWMDDPSLTREMMIERAAWKDA